MQRKRIVRMTLRPRRDAGQSVARLNERFQSRLKSRAPWPAHPSQQLNGWSANRPTMLRSGLAIGAFAFSAFDQLGALLGCEALGQIDHRAESGGHRKGYEPGRLVPARAVWIRRSAHYRSGPDSAMAFATSSTSAMPASSYRR